MVAVCILTNRISITISLYLKRYFELFVYITILFQRKRKIQNGHAQLNALLCMTHTDNNNIRLIVFVHLLHSYVWNCHVSNVVLLTFFLYSFFLLYLCITTKTSRCIVFISFLFCCNPTFNCNQWPNI